MTLNAAPTPAAPSTGSGRPRDPRIDAAVLQATVDLLEEVGYLQLTIGAIAARAGTTKPAIYRRWPTKAHLVHEAVFPDSDPAELSDDGDLRADIRTLVVIGLDLLCRPAARAALPGLMAEIGGDLSLHAEMIERFTGGTWAWFEDRLAHAIEVGEARPGVEPSMVLDLVSGATFVATTSRQREALDDSWIDDVVDVIARGIAP